MLPVHNRPIRCQILCQIRDHITGDLHGSGAPRRAGGGDRINAGSMIHKVSVKPGGSDLIFTEVSGELMDDGSNHLQVPQLFCPQTLEMITPPYQSVRGSFG